MSKRLDPSELAARLDTATAKALDAAEQARTATRECHEATRAARDELDRLRQEGRAELQGLLDQTVAATARWEAELKAVLQAEKNTIHDLAADLVVKTLDSALKDMLEEIKTAEDGIHQRIERAVEDLVARDEERSKRADRISVVEFMGAREVARLFMAQAQRDRVELGDELAGDLPALGQIRIEKGSPDA